MDSFAQIEIGLVCRFGELTKNEIVVLCYLFASRSNADNADKRCNPRRKTIAEDTKMDKRNVTRAVKGLMVKGWIAEDEHGNFSLFSAHQIPPPHEAEEKLGGKDDLSPEQKQAFIDGMRLLQTRIGKYPDGGAQAKALKWMLTNGATLWQIEHGLERQLAEVQGRYRVSYTTLQKDIFRWLKEGDETIGSYGSSKIKNRSDTSGLGDPESTDEILRRIGAIPAGNRL
ncbi:MAG: helix-turn-helix domain-containing protein [Acidobacteria bacterium]|nr:helix-turn-helix domain-containing protein [Acidobacteriota bacterium]